MQNLVKTHEQCLWLWQGHYKGTSGGGNTKVDAETGETAAVLSGSNDPDPRKPHVPLLKSACFVHIACVLCKNARILNV